jgi:hypothetical protein
MSAIGWPVAAILPLDNIGAMWRWREHSGTKFQQNFRLRLISLER